MANGIRSDLAYRHAVAAPVRAAAARGDGARELLYLSPGGAGRMHALAPLQNLGWTCAAPTTRAPRCASCNPARACRTQC